MVNKTYTAILYGHLTENRGLIEYPIAKDTENFPLQKICYETGKKSVTQYYVIERLDNPARTRVLFVPLTGRTHQLRIHSREFGHPSLGCDLYKNEESFAMAERLLLHATTIEFIHPLTQEKIHGLCPSPF